MSTSSSKRPPRLSTRATGLVDAEAAVADAKGAVDAAVADPKGTAESVVEQATNTVENPTGTIKDIAEKTPAGKVVNNVTKSLDPVVSSSEDAIGSPSGRLALPALPRRHPKQRDQAQASRPASHPQCSREPAGLLSSGTGSHSHARPAWLDRVVFFGADRPDRRAVGSGRLDAAGAGFASAKAYKVSSAAPAAPFAPLPPGDQPATAASVAGAAGAALLAALFSALFFLAPRAGRLARPGPNLVRAEPCLSLPERPG